MNAEAFLEHAAGVVTRRRREYGEPVDLFEHIAKRWSLTLGTKISPAQAVLCLIDVKMARLARDPEASRQPGRRRRLRRLPARGDEMTGPAGYRSSLARAAARSPVARDRAGHDASGGVAPSGRRGAAT